MSSEDATLLATVTSQAKRRSVDHPNGTMKKIALGTAGSAVTALIFWLGSLVYGGGVYLYSLTYTIPQMQERMDQVERRIENLEAMTLEREKRDIDRHVEVMNALRELRRRRQGGSE